MARSIIHRGPDDEGFWSDQDIALGFRRLSIVDLQSGHQPMSNEDGSIWVVFNGEIYNHRILRKELEEAGHRFASDHSDTEVLVHGYEQWGEGLLGRLNGMFAFALWDSHNKRLMLGRDRLGIKPLYLAECSNGSLVFASEIRAILASGLVDCHPDPHSVFTYFQQQNLWQGRSFFRGIRQLEGGHILVDNDRRRVVSQFWDMSFQRHKICKAEAAEALRHSVEAAIKRQIAADVPVVSYLSGGIDSSAITAGAYRIDPAIKAYSCLFNLDEVGDDRVVDEREFSRAVASSLAIDHIELELPPISLMGSLHRTVHALEEPRMGMAYVNYLIAERVAQDSKVVLSGCGGDEILGGYVARYAYVQPGPGERARKNSFLRRLFDRVRTQQATFSPRDRIQALYAYPIPPGEVASAFTPEFLSQVEAYALPDAIDRVLKSCHSLDAWDELMYIDAKTYLSGLLMVEDKLSMAHGLEARVPLLDNEIIDLALTFDWSLLTDGSTGKIVFRDAIRDWVPPIVADKPKMGFGPPDASWYRGPLQDYIRTILSPSRIAERGVFNVDYVQKIVDSHMDSTVNRLPLIWSLLSFDAWSESFDVYGGDLGNPMRPISA